MRFAFVPFILVIAVLLLPAAVLAQATFTVTNTNNSGTGSFHAAILDANTNAGADVIAFNISGVGPHAIQPGSALPYISDAITIDGLTQPEANCSSWPPSLIIEIDGSQAGANASGLAFGGQASGSTGPTAQVLHWETPSAVSSPRILVPRSLVGRTTPMANVVRATPSLSTAGRVSG